MKTCFAIVIALGFISLPLAGVCSVALVRAAVGLLFAAIMIARLSNKAALPHGREAKGEQKQHCYKTGEHAGSMRIDEVYVPCSSAVPALGREEHSGWE